MRIDIDVDTGNLRLSMSSSEWATIDAKAKAVNKSYYQYLYQDFAPAICGMLRDAMVEDEHEMLNNLDNDYDLGGEG